MTPCVTPELYRRSHPMPVSVERFAISPVYGNAQYSAKAGVLSTNSNSNSPGTAPVCGDQAPGAKAPWLYGALPQDGDSILLYFTEADNPVDKYVLEYGTKSGDYPYGSTNIGGKGTRTYLVQSLLPKTTYYFKVRGGNGCATGPWSNEISATTKGLVSFNQLEITQSELETRPVEGAKVSLHSQVQEATTDKEGLAQFKNVEPGEHKVLIAYNNFKGEQTINLTGDVKEFDLNITIKAEKVTISPIVYGVIGVMGLAIVILLILLRKKS